MRRPRVHGAVHALVLSRSELQYAAAILGWASQHGHHRHASRLSLDWWLAVQENGGAWTVSLLRGLVGLTQETVRTRLQSWPAGWEIAPGGYLVRSWLVLAMFYDKVASEDGFAGDLSRLEGAQVSLCPVAADALPDVRAGIRLLGLSGSFGELQALWNCVPEISSLANEVRGANSLVLGLRLWNRHQIKRLLGMTSSA